MSNAAAINRPGRCDLYVVRGRPGSVAFTFPSGSDLSGVDECKVTDGDTEIDLSANIVIASNVATISYSGANATAMTSGSNWSWYLADADDVAYLEGRVFPANLVGSGVGSGVTSAVQVGTIDGTVSVTVASVGTPGTDGEGVPAGGSTGQVLAKASGTDYDTEWTAAGSGDVVGPGSAVDGNFASFDTTTGKLIQDSGSAASDFATAAQGALADTATQPGDLGTAATRDVGTGSGDVAAGDAPATATNNTVASTGATETLAFATDPDSIVHDVTMDQDCTFSFSGAPSSGTTGSMTVIIRGAFTPTLPASVDWAGGSAPTYGSPSVYEFVTVDGGTTVLGFLAGATVS